MHHILHHILPKNSYQTKQLEAKPRTFIIEHKKVEKHHTPVADSFTPGAQVFWSRFVLSMAVHPQGRSTSSTPGAQVTGEDGAIV